MKKILKKATTIKKIKGKVGINKETRKAIRDTKPRKAAARKIATKKATAKNFPAKKATFKKPLKTKANENISLISNILPASKTTVAQKAITVCANNDQAILAWSYADPIADCIGFAIYRKLNQGPPTALMNRIGFEDEVVEKGTVKPTHEWPVQRFMWTDFSLSDGDEATYKVVPVLYDGTNLIEDKQNETDWSAPVMAKTGVDIKGKASPYHAYFNRGIIASQFFARMRNDLSDQPEGASIKSITDGPQSKLRDFLGGFLDNRLFKLLDEIAANPNWEVYGALYELHQKDLIEKLGNIKDRAHIILANGAAKAKDEDKNEDSRKEIRDLGVDVIDRIVDVTKKHFAHNKFLVIEEKGNPIKVWTGSTNWTPGGMFAQVNNALLLEDPAVAAFYKSEWLALKTDSEDNASDYGEPLYKQNKSFKKFGTGKSKVWFTPTHDFSDLLDVETLMENATDGILFFMFNPGPQNSFFNYIQDLQKRRIDKLFIHGVINQDPGGANPLIFFHRGEKIETDWDAIIPKKVEDPLNFWDKEVSGGLVTIHSKVLVIDPFGDTPLVVTGSHNFGPKASATNDENLIIINDPSIARQYAVNVMAVYDHYRWRYSLYNKNTTFKGLTKDREWMAQYMSNSLRMKELKFWM